MSRGVSSARALAAGSALTNDVGSLFPVRLRLAGDDLEFVLVLPGGRNNGAEPLDHPFAQVQELIRVRSHDAASLPRFLVDAGGQWARLRVELPGTAVRALIVMPEEVAAQSLNAPFLGRWQHQMLGTVRLALDEIARILARCHHRTGGAEPLIDLDLVYLPVHDYPARVAGVHEPVREFVAPVRPMFRMGWRSMTSLQRKVFIGDLADVGTAGRWPRRRLTARVMGLEVELPVWPATSLRDKAHS